MQQFGRQVCANQLMSPSGTADQKLAATYYDAERVYLQIADYLHDDTWLPCAAEAQKTYRDNYVMREDLRGRVPAYWIFPTGLYLSWKKYADEKSRDAIVSMSQKGAFCGPLTSSDLSHTLLSREVAYCGLTYLQSEAMGNPREPRRDALIDASFGHLRSWIDNNPKSFGPTPFRESPRCAGKSYVQPFMVGLTMHTLIQLFDFTGDPRVLPAVKEAVDWLWAKHWVAADQAFVYENCVDAPGAPYPAQRGAPDLNLLIAPAFAWVWQQTKEAKYQQQGDQIFEGGVTRAWISPAKQFNQNYMWSFEYVRWRGGWPAQQQQKAGS